MISLVLEIISRYTLLVIETGGYFGVFILMALESANIPIPSEVIMPFSGFLASPAGPPAGGFNFWLVIFIGAFGNLIGSLFSYWLGYLVRHNVLHWDNHRVGAEVERAQKWLNKWGDWAIFISRILPVVRTFISFPLGVLKTKSLWRFSILTFSGSLLWSLFLTELGFITGQNWHILSTYFRKFDYLILVVIIAGIAWIIWKYFKNKNKDL